MSLDAVEAQINRLLVVIPGRGIKKANDLVTVLLQMPACLCELLTISVYQEKRPTTNPINVEMRSAIALEMPSVVKKS